MKQNNQNNREYTASNGMVLKTKNAKNSWIGKDDEKPEILHETRRSSFWKECVDSDMKAIAKHVDARDAMEWLKKNKYMRSAMEMELKK